MEKKLLSYLSLITRILGSLQRSCQGQHPRNMLSALTQPPEDGVNADFSVEEAVDMFHLTSSAQSVRACTEGRVIPGLPEKELSLCISKRRPLFSILFYFFPNPKLLAFFTPSKGTNSTPLCTLS